MILESMLGLALSMPIDPDLKCPRTHHLPGFPEESAVILVDGEIRGHNIDSPVIDDIDPADVHGIAIRCWNPDTDDLPASSGVQLILISTKGPVARAEAETLAAANLVHAFVAEHGAVPTSAERVDARLEGFTLEIRELGWVLTSPDTEGFECVASQVGSEAGEVECSTTYSVVKRALRTAWERGARAVELQHR